jgi:hypothetical protein
MDFSPKDLARTCLTVDQPHMRCTPDASQAQHDASDKWEGFTLIPCVILAVFRS